MDVISRKDYKILKHIARHQPVSYEKIAKRYKLLDKERLDRLIKKGLIYFKSYEDIAHASTAEPFVFTLTPDGQILIENYKEQRNYNRLLRVLDFVAGMAAGAATTILGHWLISFLL